MKRKIYIISKDTVIDDKVKAEAKTNGCSEIAKGVPRRLLEKASVLPKLPFVYEEDNIQPPSLPIDDEVTTLKKIIEDLQKDVNELKGVKNA
jgi:hypothetical protein